MRITILGLPGSGKSTLARRIAAQYRIPYIHLDWFWLEGGGGHSRQTTPDPEQAHAHMRSEVLEAIQSDSWVSDGGYPLIQPEIAKSADTMVFLDMPLRLRLFNQMKRTVRSIGGQGELSFWSNVQFMREMTQPDLRNTSIIKAFLDAFKGKKVILRAQSEVREYIRTLD